MCFKISIFNASDHTIAENKRAKCYLVKKTPRPVTDSSIPTKIIAPNRQLFSSSTPPKIKPKDAKFFHPEIQFVTIHRYESIY